MTLSRKRRLSGRAELRIRGRRQARRDECYSGISEVTGYRLEFDELEACVETGSLTAAAL